MNSEESDKDELDERRQAKVAFVSSAYTPDEAWCAMDERQGPLYLHWRERHEPPPTPTISGKAFFYELTEGAALD